MVTAREVPSPATMMLEEGDLDGVLMSKTHDLFHAGHNRLLYHYVTLG